MKRDWDVIREILIEVEALDGSKFEQVRYGLGTESGEPVKGYHGVLLWEAGFIKGANASTMAGDAVIAQGLTWAGHDLLETMRSKPVWERIKATATDKGIELTFETVKMLGKLALDSLLSGG